MAETISSGRIIKKPDIVLDPNFDLPPGLEDVRMEDTTETDRNPANIVGGDRGASSTLQVTDDGTDGSELDTPYKISVFSQTLKMGTNGQLVVDVVIDIEDIPGVTDFELRVNK